MTEVFIITGVTCSGKTSMSMELARREGAEIISCDSVQIYRGMDIGSAKASAEEMSEIPHHLVDVCDCDKHFDVSEYVALAKKALEDTTPLESIDYTFYDAIVLPGGHGPMFDLAKSELIGEIVSNFDKKNKIIAAVCHGPAGLLTAEKDGSPYVNNRLLTAFTNEEEIEYKKDKLTPFMLEDALIERGAVFKNGGIGAVNVIEDGNLITGQNFQSAELFASTIIRRLKNRE